METTRDGPFFEQVLLVGAYFHTSSKQEALAHLLELKSLVDTLDIEVPEVALCPIRKFDISTYIGKGKVEELVQKAKKSGVQAIIFDDEILPSQVRNLEKAFKLPVLDRTEVILEVFSKRAKTNEAKLQIELARSMYQLPRLKRMWTHLSRQRAKGGYLRGTGEKQIETDRRLLKTRISQLKEQIKKITKDRNIQRAKREKSGIPTFAIVGYTNAGKSTLMKALTDADVLIEDKLFATLYTTTRKMTLPNNQDILLIDTVGFIRKIPTNLVASFKSTLEEAVLGDVLLHIVDVSDPQALDHATQTIEVLQELGVDKRPIITVLNKVDECKDKSLFDHIRLLYPSVVEISAKKGEGFEELFERMQEKLSSLRCQIKVRIPQKDYGVVHNLLEEGQVVWQNYLENHVEMEVNLPKSKASRYESYLF